MTRSSTFLSPAAPASVAGTAGVSSPAAVVIEVLRQPGRRPAHLAQGADGGIDGVHREGLLGTLHGDDLGVPGVGEADVEELEPRR